MKIWNFWILVKPLTPKRKNHQLYIVESLWTQNPRVNNQIKNHSDILRSNRDRSRLECGDKIIVTRSPFPDRCQRRQMKVGIFFLLLEILVRIRLDKFGFIEREWFGTCWEDWTCWMDGRDGSDMKLGQTRLNEVEDGVRSINEVVHGAFLRSTDYSWWFESVKRVLRVTTSGSSGISNLTTLNPIIFLIPLHYILVLISIISKPTIKFAYLFYILSVTVIFCR